VLWRCCVPQNLHGSTLQLFFKFCFYHHCQEDTQVHHNLIFKNKNCIPYVYFKFKEYVLFMSTGRVHCGTLYNNTSRLPLGTLHNRRPVNHHGWRAQLFFHLFSLQLPPRRYPIAPYCNLKNSKIVYLTYFLKVLLWNLLCFCTCVLQNIHGFNFHFVLITMVKRTPQYIILPLKNK